MKKPWKAYTFWIALSQATGALSAWLTRDGMQLYINSVRKPPLTPPGIVFPIVWGILYALMGIGAARISFTEDSFYRQHALQNFLLQLAANFLWTILFFGCHAYGLSLLWLLLLWNLVLRMIRSFRQVDKTAGNLQIPYLLWVTLAAFLNLGVWFLNR